MKKGIKIVHVDEARLKSGRHMTRAQLKEQEEIGKAMEREEMAELKKAAQGHPRAQAFIANVEREPEAETGKFGEGQYLLGLGEEGQKPK